MTEEQIKRSRRHFEITGAVICSIFFGYFLWVLSLPSTGEITPSDHLSLVLYLLLTLTCYLGAFWLLDKYFVLPPKNIRPNWIAISLIGTSLSFIVKSIHIWWKHRSMNGTERLGEFLPLTLRLLGVCNVIVLPVMAFIWSIGLIIRLTRKEMANYKVVPD